MFPHNHDHFYGNGHETQFYDQQNVDYAYQQTNLSKSGKLMQKIKFFTQKYTGNHSFLSSKFCGFMRNITKYIRVLFRLYGYTVTAILQRVQAKITTKGIIFAKFKAFNVYFLASIMARRLNHA